MEIIILVDNFIIKIYLKKYLNIYLNIQIYIKRKMGNESSSDSGGNDNNNESGGYSRADFLNEKQGSNDGPYFDHGGRQLDGNDYSGPACLPGGDRNDFARDAVFDGRGNVAFCGGNDNNNYDRNNGNNGNDYSSMDYHDNAPRPGSYDSTSHPGSNDNTPSISNEGLSISKKVSVGVANVSIHKNLVEHAINLKDGIKGNASKNLAADVVGVVLGSVNEKYRARGDFETNIRTSIAGYALTGAPGSTVAGGALVGSEVLETIAHSKVLEDPHHQGHLEKFHKDYNEAKNNKDKALQIMASNTYMFDCIKTSPYVM